MYNLTECQQHTFSGHRQSQWQSLSFSI